MERTFHCVVATPGQVRVIQRLLMEMMDDLYDVCDQHDISLYLGGGTALGAVRHGGFIPWDDDVDMNLFRSDYIRLLPLIKQGQFAEKYMVYTPGNKRDYAKTCIQIRMRGTSARALSDLALEECGVCVDLFIIENVSNCISLRKTHGLLCQFLGFAVLSRRRWRDRKIINALLKDSVEDQLTGIPDAGTAGFHIKRFAGFFFAIIPLHVWVRWADSSYGLCHDDESKFVSIISGKRHFFGETMERGQITGGRRIAFNGRMLPVYAEVEGYLRQLYGPDYMQVPARKEQEQHAYFELNIPMV